MMNTWPDGNKARCSDTGDRPLYELLVESVHSCDPFISFGFMTTLRSWLHALLHTNPWIGTHTMNESISASDGKLSI